MSNEGVVNNLINDALGQTNGPLYTALQLLIADVYAGYNTLFPSPVVSTGLFPGGASNPSSTVNNFVANLQPNNLHLTWDAVDGGGTYEIRYQPSSSTDWDSAIFLLQTTSQAADISPFTIPLLYGTYTLLIKAIDASGTYSLTAAAVQVVIPLIGAPAVTSSVIGSNVLLKWDIPTSALAIDHYEVERNGTPIGNITGTFDVIFEITGGTYVYNIVAVDIVGNRGTQSANITLTLSSPIDFTFIGNITSTLNGTKSQCCLDSDGTLFAPVNITEQYQQHFTAHSYATWQDPITAGFPLVFQPGPNSAATYTETFDFGAIEANVIVNTNYNTTRLNGTVVITTTIAVSTDNITFDAPVSGSSRFATSVRYAKVVVTFTPTNSLSSINFYGFTCSLAIQFAQDGGIVSAVSTDVSGTPITFTTPFVSVNSVTLTAQTSTLAIVVYNNLSSTGCNVFVFNAAGTRLSASVTWHARGVI